MPAIRQTLRIVLFFLLAVSTFASTSSSAGDREQVEAFVTRFYQECLQREPDPDGLAYWVDSLIDRSRTGADVAKGFILSQEFLNRGLPNQEFLDILYAAFFDRLPDSYGYDYWMDLLRNDVDRAAVLDGFIYSTEFANLCREYGITPDDQVKEFVTRFYRLCLNREPDQSGLDYWVSSLKDQSRTGADVAHGFVFSQEFIQKDLSHEDYVSILYEAFFDREPDTAGFTSWCSLLAERWRGTSGFGKIELLLARASREQVLNGFVYSQEFGDLCTKYSIKAFDGSPDVPFPNPSDCRAIEEIKITFDDFSCGGVIASGSITFSKQPPWPVSDRRFTADLTWGGSPTTSQARRMTLAGTFDQTGTRVSGSYAADFSGNNCPGVWEASPGNTAATIEWIDGQQTLISYQYSQGFLSAMKFYRKFEVTSGSGEAEITATLKDDAASPDNFDSWTETFFVEEGRQYKIVVQVAVGSQRLCTPFDRDVMIFGSPSASNTRETVITGLVDLNPVTGQYDFYCVRQYAIEGITLE